MVNARCRTDTTWPADCTECGLQWMVIDSNWRIEGLVGIDRQDAVRRHRGPHKRRLAGRAYTEIQALSP